MLNFINFNNDVEQRAYSMECILDQFVEIYVHVYKLSVAIMEGWDFKFIILKLGLLENLLFL